MSAMDGPDSAELTLMAEELDLVDSTAASRLLDLRTGLVSSEAWAVLAGAGVSKNAGVPLWDEVAEQLAVRFSVPVPHHLPMPTDSLPGVFTSCELKAPEVFWEVVADLLCQGDPVDLHRLILDMPARVFLTVNVDCLLQRRHQDLDDVPYPRVLAYPDLHASELSGKRLFQLHGVCDESGTGPRLSATSVVLTQGSYETAYEISDQAPLPRVITTIFSEMQVLVIGSSFNEPSIKRLVKGVRTTERRFAEETGRVDVPSRTGFAIVPRPHVPFAGERIESNSFEILDEVGSTEVLEQTFPGHSLGLHPIYYRNDDGRHLALTKIMEWLSRQTKRNASPSHYGMVKSV